MSEQCSEILKKIRKLTVDDSYTKLERCEIIKQLMNNENFATDLKKKFHKEYDIIIGTFGESEYIDKVARFIINNYISNGNWHLFNKSRFIDLLNNVEKYCSKGTFSYSENKFDIMKQEISDIHGIPTSSFVKSVAKIQKTAFDLSRVVYMNEETRVLLVCGRCRKQHHVLPKKALNPVFKCFSCFTKRNYSYLKNGNTDSSTYYSKILDGLFLGDINSILDEKFLNNCKIKAAVDLHGGTQKIRTIDRFGIETLTIKIDDNAHAKIEKYFDRIFGFIDKQFAAGKTVLVFCRAGVSRSATSVIGYLMEKSLATYDEVFKYVKSRRPKIYPNQGFIKQLKSLEDRLNE